MSAGFCNVFTGHNRSIHYLTDNVYGSGIVEGHFAGYTTRGAANKVGTISRERLAQSVTLIVTHFTPETSFSALKHATTL